MDGSDGQWFAAGCENKYAHNSKAKGWYHRFGSSGGQYCHQPCEVSSVQWPAAYWTGENKQRLDSNTEPPNYQSQPGPQSLAPITGLRGVQKHRGNNIHTDSESNLPYKNNTETFTYPTNGEFNKYIHKNRNTYKTPKYLHDKL